jgi:GT2 family glycosyltransferase
VLHFTSPMHDVSVVVVTFNSAPWIERCLESVRGYETIVVDHGSADETLEIVRGRFPEAHVIEEENVGMGGGNNAGMRLASGRYFLLLNSDAWILGDAACRTASFIGNRFADGWLDPARHQAGVAGGRMRAVIHRRPWPSNIELCTSLRLVQSS